MAITDTTPRPNGGRRRPTLRDRIEDEVGLLPKPWERSPLIRALLDVFTDVDVDDLDELERALAACTAAIRKTYDARSGRRIMKHWGGAGCPGWDDDEEIQYTTLGTHLIDHGYRVKSPDGSEQWRAEPYEISGEDLFELVALAQDGWRIWLRADQARHFPGATICITYQRDDVGGGDDED